MNKRFLVLNFMHCMERFATQIYLTQGGAFKHTQLALQLADASANERTHVQKLGAQIKNLNGTVYPFGWLFQFLGVFLGVITRLTSKRNLFKADTFVETRAVKDYNGFLKSVHFDTETVNLIKGLIVDEEAHVINWKKAGESLAKRR